MLESIKKQVSGVIVTNKINTLITIGLICLFTALAIWFYKKYVIPSLNEDAYMENSVYRKGGNGDVIIYFFHTEWCPHCKKAMPVWELFMGDIGDNHNGHAIDYRTIDCEKDKQTADKFNVTTYPTIKLVYRNKTYEYDARPDRDTLEKFLDTSIE